jgi:hypothetical protein
MREMQALEEACGAIHADLSRPPTTPHTNGYLFGGPGQFWIRKGQQESRDQMKWPRYWSKVFFMEAMCRILVISCSAHGCCHFQTRAMVRSPCEAWPCPSRKPGIQEQRDPQSPVEHAQGRRNPEAFGLGNSCKA